MNELISLQIEAVELRHLLEQAADDPILAPQLRERLDEAEQKLAAARRLERPPLTHPT